MFVHAEWDARAKVWALEVEGVGVTQAESADSIEKEVKDFVAVMQNLSDQEAEAVEVKIIWAVK